MLLRTLFSLIIASPAIFAAGEDKGPTDKEIAAMQKAMKAISELKYQSGEISLIGGKAKIKLGDEFRYLDPANARKLLVDVWGNPPEAGSSEGIIVSKDVDFTEGDAWVAVIEWTDDGYVKDEEFASLNFGDMLKELKEQSREQSKLRVAKGYPKLELANWAKQPHYDRDTHKLYYAKAYDCETPPQQLNYDIRVLGRQGCLEVSIMSSMPKLAEIESKAPAILAMLDFTEGNRYTDYKSGDKVAAYGIGGLIAGGVLAKTGLLKGLLLFLAKGWKLVLVGLVVVGALIKRIASGKQQRGSGF